MPPPCLRYRLLVMNHRDAIFFLPLRSEGCPKLFQDEQFTGAIWRALHCDCKESGEKISVSASPYVNPARERQLSQYRNPLSECGGQSKPA